MPATSQTQNGPFASVAAMPLRFETFTFTGVGIQNSRILFADGLPGLRVWGFQGAGAAAVVTFLVQFADGNDGAGNPQWANLVPIYNLAPFVPSLNLFSLGSRQYRLQVTATAACTVQYRIAAALT